jgi:hypothetical protein
MLMAKGIAKIGQLNFLFQLAIEDIQSNLLF